MSDEDTFARRLRRVIYATGMSQSEFADYTGVSRACINEYLKGKSEPRWRVLRKIMLATGCTARDLLGGAE